MIETERLLLRPFIEKDAADVFEYLREPAVNCFASMKLDSLAEAKEEMKKRAGETEYYFAIVLKETGKVIGEIEAYPERGEPHDTSSPLDTFSPCWMLNEAYQGKGYAYEAAHAFFDYLFHDKGARRIYAYTEDYNLPSQHLCKRLGMRREGLFMEFISFVNNPDGSPRYENTVQYAILKKEWLWELLWLGSGKQRKALNGGAVMDNDILSFFGEHMDALPNYERLENAILTRVPDVKIKEAKTQITFANKRGFAFVSFNPCRKAKDRPAVWMTVTFGLGYHKESPRIDVATEPYPGRWTHHVMVGSVDEIDEELLGWIQEAAEFSASKR